MNIAFQYNWPIGENAVTLSFGMQNVSDDAFLFRVGVVSASDQTKVYWQGIQEWLSPEELVSLNFGVRQGDTIVFDKKNIESQVIEARGKWDTTEEWPVEAHGDSSTHISYWV